MDNFYCLVVTGFFTFAANCFNLWFTIKNFTGNYIGTNFNFISYLLFVYLPSSPELEKTKTNIEKLQQTYSLFPPKMELACIEQ